MFAHYSPASRAPGGCAAVSRRLLVMNFRPPNYTSPLCGARVTFAIRSHRFFSVPPLCDYSTIDRRFFSSAPSPPSETTSENDNGKDQKSPLGSSHAIVENTGSVARDHLANERTFLAWAKVGLAFTAAGTALFSAYHTERELADRVSKYSLENKKQDQQKTSTNTDVPEKSQQELLSTSTQRNRSSAASSRNARKEKITLASGLLWANGGLLLLYSLYRYLSVQRALLKGQFILAKRGLFAVTFCTAVCTGGALVLVYLS
ncbi:unnamed protein product [Amoebophrya sp. A120]|nr:unnamed protein product [Amoebophrya sp. A120]|eukprot:GSA120T00005873001.1